MGKRKGRRPAAKARGGAGAGWREPEPQAEKTEEEAEGESDFCFVCKDGGDLRLCDHRNCHKAYHPHCVGEGEDFLKSDDEFICRWHKCFICKQRSCFRCLCCPGNSVCRACLTQADFAQVGNQTKGFCANCLRTAIMIDENVEVNSDGMCKRGASRFLTSLWQMCKNTNDVAHQSLALNQETRRRHNEFMAARNASVPPPGPEVEPVIAPTWQMPPIDDEMLQNFDLSMYAHGSLPPRPAAGNGGDDDGDEEHYNEDDDEEVDDDDDDDGDGSTPPTGTEFY